MSTLTREGLCQQLILMLLARMEELGLPKTNALAREFRVILGRVLGSGQEDLENLFYELCVYASSNSIAEDSNEWTLDQDVCFLRISLERHKDDVPEEALRQIKAEFEEMIQWRRICIAAVQLYEMICNPPESVIFSPLPWSCWHDLRERERIEFISFVWEMEDLLRLVAKPEDPEDPAWAAADALRSVLPGAKPIDTIKRLLAEASARG